jgi:hypothetical protein
MNRRRFVQSAACAGMLSQTAAPLGAQESSRKTRLYRLDFFHYRQGDQATRLNQLFSSQTALLAKHCRSLGMFNGVLAPHVQTLMVLSGFPSFDDMVAAGRAVESDSGFQKAWEEFERGAEPPYDSAERSLLMATDFSPEVAPLAEKPKAPRYFEMRVYHAPTQRQLRMVHERFAGPEIKIFHRVGVHPILYADTVFGNEMPNLTYLIPFDSLDAREKAWDAFGADPEWVKVRAESVARGGQIVNYQNISLWRAAPYSPIQ